MFGNLWNSIRIAYMAQMISNKHFMESPHFLSNSYQHPDVQTLFATLNPPTSTGIHVLWGVYESGKTTAARQAGWRLQQEAGRTVIYLRGYDFFFKDSLRKWFNIGIGLSGTEEDPVYTFFNRPTTIIIDDFDILMTDKRVGDTLEFMREVAEESAGGHSFNVLLILTSWERALQLKKQGYCIVPSFGKWTEEQLTKLLATLPEPARDCWTQRGDLRTETLRIATISGTAGDLRAGLSGERLSKRRASILDLEWQKGTRALRLHHHACGDADDDSLEDLSDALEGRFPDRNGIFHWEDLSS